MMPDGPSPTPAQSLLAQIAAARARGRTPAGAASALEGQLLARLGFPPTPDQAMALSRLARFCTDDTLEKPVFILRGYAGTGKTTLVSALARTVRASGLNVYLMAPTGRAAKVMSLYARRTAYTIHRTIFKAPEDGAGGGGIGTGPARLQNNRHGKTLFIVDEASMIGCEGDDNLLAPLLSFVFQHPDNRLLLVGDDAQLPPVSMPESLALDARFLHERYRIGVEQAVLRQVVRQGAQSGILANATRLRATLSSGDLRLGLHTRTYPDTFSMTGERLQEGLEYAYRKYGREQTLVICRSNKQATRYNHYIRARLLYLDSQLDGGDLVMVVRNNYLFGQQAPSGFLANGDFARVRRVVRIETMHGLEFADLELELLDYPDAPPLSVKAHTSTLVSEGPGLDPAAREALYQAVSKDYEHIGNNRERIAAMRADPYLHALQLKFAYALTCHKAQGGQWDAVFVEQGYLPDPEAIDRELIRWLYTACTRARQELYLVGFWGQFFDPEPIALEDLAPAAEATLAHGPDSLDAPLPELDEPIDRQPVPESPAVPEPEPFSESLPKPEHELVPEPEPEPETVTGPTLEAPTAAPPADDEPPVYNEVAAAMLARLAARRKS